MADYLDERDAALGALCQALADSVDGTVLVEFGEGVPSRASELRLLCRERPDPDVEELRRRRVSTPRLRDGGDVTAEHPEHIYPPRWGEP